MDQGLAEQERSVLLSAEHAARQVAEEAHALVEAILASAPVGIAVFDLDLRYVRVNDALAEMSGLDNDVLGRSIFDVFPAFEEQLGPPLRSVLASGEPVLGLEVRGETPADPGVERFWDVSFFAVRSERAAIVGVGGANARHRPRRAGRRACRRSADDFGDHAGGCRIPAYRNRLILTHTSDVDGASERRLIPDRNPWQRRGNVTI